MEETGQDEMRPESTNSDNGSEGGFVEVTREDAQIASQSWGEQTSAPLDEDADLYSAAEDRDDGIGEEEEGEVAAAAEELEDEEKPLSPPPSPVSPSPEASNQLIDFGFDNGSANPPLLVATAPEPLVPMDQSEFNLDDVLHQMPNPLVPTNLDDVAPQQQFTTEQSSDVKNTFVPIVSTPPPERTPSPEHKPSPPPPPVPERDPPPPPPPERTPTPPPPPPKDPRPIEQKVTFASGVEEVAPPTTPTPSPQKGRMPKPRGYLKFLQALHPVVLYIIYWRDLKLSAVVLGVCLVVLLTLTLNTLLHTGVLLLLSFMVVSLTYIVSKIAIDSFYNRKVVNPFHSYLEKRIALPEELMMEWAAYGIKRLEEKVNRIVHLLLFANIKQSLAFGVGLWVASFITNYLTLLRAMFALVGVAFSVPWLYDRFQSHIDGHVDTVATKLATVGKKVMSYIPFGGKKKAD